MLDNYGFAVNKCLELVQQIKTLRTCLAEHYNSLELEETILSPINFDNVYV